MILNFVTVLLVSLGVSAGKFPLVPDSHVTETRADPGYRLPTDTVPKRYNITLEPFFEPGFRFIGYETVEVEVVEPTNTITLHAYQLTIDDTTLTVKSQNEVDEDIEIHNVTLNAQYQLLIIYLVEEVEPGDVLDIYIEFTGQLNSQNAGFYRASYVEDGVTKWFGTTQFQATDARQAFPCYDEPALKATFIINIIRTEDYASISNMNIEDTEDLGDGRLVDRFEESVVMPTYLVAFVVSALDSVTKENQAVYGVPSLINDDRGDYALDAGINIIETMEEFTNVPYSLDKLYQVAIPDNWFAAGAMENWGLVTYRERYLLYKSGLSTSSEKQTVATIIAHELGHQWFGNLVSPLWWDYIWLNEGFATYFEYYAASVLEPTMRLMDQFVTYTVQYAMESDALLTTRPMTFPAESPNQINSLFDTVAYDKSGSVIRMMEHMLTTEIFKRGLTIYLNNKQFAAAEPADLWNGLQAAVDELEPTLLGDLTVEEIMETWNSQAGYPVINVEKTENEIILTQSRFVLNDANYESDSIWIVPINYATASDPDFSSTSPTILLQEEATSVDVTVDKADWIILNKQATGYYRINYDEDNWNLIIQYLNSDDYDKIHLLNRAQLLDDALTLARSDRLDYGIAMDLLTYLSRETDYIPLYSFFRGLSFLNRYLLNTEQFGGFKSFVREILQAAYDDLGPDDTGTHTDKLNRISVLTWLCRYEHDGCVEEMHNKLVTVTPVAPDLQSIVYCGGLISLESIEEKWTFLYERYNDIEVEDLERTRILNAFGCTFSVNHLNRLLDMATGQSEDFTLNNAHRTTAFSAVYSSSKLGLETAFDYVINNYESLPSSGLSNNQISSIVNGISDRLGTVEQRDRVQDLIDSLPEEIQTVYVTILNNAINNIQNNIDWIAARLGPVTEWLDARVPECVNNPRDDLGYRLPKDTVPRHYNITLEPFFQNFTFAGYETIAVEVVETTNSFVLHATELEINEHTLTVKRQNNVNSLSVTNIALETDHELLIITLCEEVQPGDQLDIYLEFTGQLNGQNRGFYRASYEEDGVTKWFGTTQFESTSARRAFPCYDEPALKATFTINIIRTEDYLSISNMNIEGTEDLGDGRFLDSFEESVIMPTYLVAFVVSALDSVSKQNQAVYGVPSLISDNRGDYALDAGISIIETMEEFTNVPYSLDKLYQVAIPDNWFAAGAMENWGLVTYRETYLLYKAGLSTASEKQRIAVIIAHELAHQWFGNLVSPLWWGYIWLNEGFARYFERYAASVWEPNMRLMDQFVTSTVQYAMETDALLTTRPMSHIAETPGEISALFDRVGYDKSGSVIRMMEHILTTEIFRRGLTIYLNNKQFSAAEPADLWNGLQGAVDELNPSLLGELTVEEIMETWNSQAGFPVINVERTEEGIVFTQSRFVLNVTNYNSDSIWIVPINYATASDPNFSTTSPTLWLQEEETTVDITVDEADWIILNKQATGYYRINYDENNWNLIIEYLNSDDYDKIHLLNRAQLLDDALTLARSGRLGFNIAMNLLTYLSRETDYIPLYSFFRGLTFLNRYLQNTEQFDGFKIFIREILQTAYEDLGSDDTGTHTDKLNRISVLTWLCRYEHEECIEEMHNKLVTATTVAPDLQSIVYCGGLINEENLEQKWSFLYERYSSNEIEELERVRIVNALGCTLSVDNLNRLLDMATGQSDDYTLSTSHRTTAFSAVYSSSKLGLETALDYVINNFESMSTSLSTSQISSIVNGISDMLTTVEQRDRLQGLIDSLPEEIQQQYATTFNNAISNIQSNIDWTEARLDPITEWLDAREVPECVNNPRDDLGYRLPTDTVPRHYNITLEPFFQNFTFVGYETILVEVVETTNSLVLHATELEINDHTLRVKLQNNVNNLSVTDIALEMEHELLIITLCEEVQPGDQLEIYVEFTGQLNDQNRGFYRASYEEDGETKWFGTTQFESTSARRAFPCYDEPALKATFIVNIIRTEDYSSISNMNIEDTEDLGDGRAIDRFEESVIMPTYLVAFVVSELDPVSKQNQAVYGVPSLINDDRGDYALDAGISIIETIEEFTNVPYSLDKLYQVAIPDNWFAAGAMENWGLVTYRETYLLYKAGLSTASEKQRIAVVIAHELGHQWFGNLVSPLWWGYIWLNEGFARYFENYAASVWEPSMRLMDQFVTSTVQYAMETDALLTTRPMSHTAETPTEISALFDRVGYDKSGSVIRMMEHILTTEIFRRGLTIYLNNKQFSAAEPADLWNGLQEAVDELHPTHLGDLTVEEIMETWNSQAGFPVINVERTEEGIVFTQSRFVLNVTNYNSDGMWIVPINYATASDPNFSSTSATLWLQEKETTVNITVDEADWIILNKQATGYYRINYDENNWNLIIEYLNSDDYDKIHVLNRAQLLDDALTLARSGRLDFDIAMNLLTYLSRETDYIPLYSFFRGLTFLNRYLLNTEQFDDFKSFVREILQTAYEDLGSNDTGTHTDKLNRISILTWLCRYEHEGCIEEMHNKLVTNTTVAPDLQSIVYCGGLISEESLEQKWSFLYQRYSGSDVEELERVRIVNAFGCTLSVDLLNRLLDMATDQSDDFTLNSAHRATAISSVYSSSKLGLETALDYMIDNFENIVSSGLSNTQISSIVSGISERLTTAEQRDRVQEFIDSLPEGIDPEHATILSNAINNIQGNIAWSAARLTSVTDWIDARGSAFTFVISMPLLIVAVLFNFVI